MHIFKNIKKKNKEEKKVKKVGKKKEKMVEVKKDGKKPVSPRIYRSITEQAHKIVTLPTKHTPVVWIIWGVVILVLCVEGLGMYYQVQQMKVVQAQRMIVQTKITKWEQVMLTHPGYRDGYMQLALLYYQLGSKIQTQKEIESALVIDPNFLPALKLKGIVLTQQ